MILAFLLLITPVYGSTTKAKVPQAKWYQDMRVAAGLDFRRQPQVNPDEAEFKTRYALYAERIWEQKWAGGFQYSYAQQDTSSGLIGVKQQNHEFLVRGTGRIYAFTNSAFWAGLSGGFNRSRLELSVGGGNKQTRWSDWEWLIAPEVSFRHGLFNNENLWMEESLSYIAREFSEQGEWSFALRVGLDLSVF